MSDLMVKEYTKFDILIEVKTLCRKSKTTGWAELVKNGLAIGETEWDENDLVIKTSGSAHARTGLLASYMTDQSRFLNQDIAKVILPELEGCANGLGHIVLVGYKEGSEKAEPLITMLFEFSQKPGEKIKVSKNPQDYFRREKEITAEMSNLLVRDLFYGLEAYKVQKGTMPRITFSDNETLPAYLRGRRFTPCLTRSFSESTGQRSVVINIQEWTTEPDDIFPPYLFSLYVEEGMVANLQIKYEGSEELTEEQKLLVRDTVFGFRDVLYSQNEGKPHTLDHVQPM